MDKSVVADIVRVVIGAAVGASIAGVHVGMGRLKKNADLKVKDAPADYVTLMDSNKPFQVLRRVAKTKDERDFVRTIRHRLSRLYKLVYNVDNRHTDSVFWKRMGVIHSRGCELLKSLEALQFMVKERLGKGPLPIFDNAVAEVRQIVEDMQHNNLSLRTENLF